MNKADNHLKKPGTNLQLYEAILKIGSVEECVDFLDDLCTVAELRAMEQRFEVATLLDAGHNYNSILEKTGASSATISRVNRCLRYGKDGYRRVIDRIKGVTP
jgi:TrpR-related protein YerC/YecD